MKMLRVKCNPSKESEKGEMLQGISIDQACPDTLISHERPVKLEQLVDLEKRADKNEP